MGPIRHPLRVDPPRFIKSAISIGTIIAPDPNHITGLLRDGSVLVAMEHKLAITTFRAIARPHGSTPISRPRLHRSPIVFTSLSIPTMYTLNIPPVATIPRIAILMPTDMVIATCRTDIIRSTFRVERS